MDNNSKKTQTPEDRKIALRENLILYSCTICKKDFYVIDEDTKNKELYKGKTFEGKTILEKLGNCPYCKADKKHILTKLTEKQKKKKKDKESKKEEQEKSKTRKIAEIEKEKIFDEVKALVKDLRKKLFDGKITPEQFTKYFMVISFDIAKKNADELEIDWVYYRKLMLQFVQDVLDSCSVKINCEQEYENFNEDIEESKIYNSLNEKYINNDKYAVRDLEMKTEIETEFERKRMLKEHEKLTKIAEKYEKKDITFDENELKKELRRNVSNI